MRSLREIPGIEIFKVEKSSPYSHIISAQAKVTAKSIHYHI